MYCTKLMYFLYLLGVNKCYGYGYGYGTARLLRTQDVICESRVVLHATRDTNDARPQLGLSAVTQERKEISIEMAWHRLSEYLRGLMQWWVRRNVSCSTVSELSNYHMSIDIALRNNTGMWNKLPRNMRDNGNLAQFKKH